MIQSIIDKSQHDRVKLHESRHYSKVNVVLCLWLEAKVMRYDPVDSLSLELCLIVISLYGDENLPQGASSNDCLHKLDREPSTENGLFPGYVSDRWKSTEQEAQCQTVVEVPESVYERWITFLDNVVEFQCWMLVQVTLHRAKVSGGTCFAHFFVESL